MKVQPLPRTIDYAVRATTRPGEAPVVSTQPESRSEYQYLARLAELTPGGSCRYEVSGGGQRAGGAFRTLADAGEEFTFIAYGDSQEAEGHRKVAAGFGRHKPRLILHTGDLVGDGDYFPNLSAEFFEPLAGLADERPVVFYNQLGSGKSDRPDDPALWVLDRFVEEVAQVRAALSLARVHLLGQSWGTTLATAYALTQPCWVTRWPPTQPLFNPVFWGLYLRC